MTRLKEAQALADRLAAENFKLKLQLDDVKRRFHALCSAEAFRLKNGADDIMRSTWDYKGDRP